MLIFAQYLVNLCIFVNYIAHYPEIAINWFDRITYYFSAPKRPKEIVAIGQNFWIVWSVFSKNVVRNDFRSILEFSMCTEGYFFGRISNFSMYTQYVFAIRDRWLWNNLSQISTNDKSLRKFFNLKVNLKPSSSIIALGYILYLLFATFMI